MYICLKYNGMIKDDIQQPAILNKAIHKFESVLAKRIFYALESQIKKGFGVQKDIYNDLWLNVPTDILGNQHFKDLDKAADELHKARFNFVDKENECFNKINPFPVVQYQKRWGHVKVKIEKEALGYLAELTQGYFWYKLKAALSLTSKYAQRWYELFSEKKDLEKWLNVEVDDIRKIMGIEEFEYKRNSDMIKWVVYDPIEEVNRKTDVFIEYEFIKNQKRPIIGFNFFIKGQKAKGESEIYERIEKYFDELSHMKPSEISQKLLAIMREYSIPDKLYNEMFKNQNLLNAVLEADAKIQAGKVDIQTTKAQYMGGVIQRAKGQK